MLRSRTAVRSMMISITFLGALPELAFGGDWYVDVNDPGCPNGNGSAGSPFCDIGTAVSAAANGDTIHIAAGTYFERLVLNKSLTLIGTSGAATTIVDGSSGGTAITVTWKAAVDLQGLTITHGSAVYGGGLLVDVSSDATLDSCVVSDNSAQFGGGLSASSATNVTLTGCVVSGNVAVQYSPYDPNASGGGIYSVATLTITSTTITNNYSNATGGGIGGGGIGTVTLIDSEVSGNHVSAPSASGGIAGGGAGIGIYGGTLHLTRSKIVSNHNDYDLPNPAGGGIAASAVDGSEVEITGNHAAGAGGGISTTTSLNLTDSVIAGNDAGGGGGGLQVIGNAILTDCLIENNKAAAGAGGGAVLYDAGGTITLDRCTFRGNVAAGDGGGAMVSNNTYFNGTSITLRDCVFTDNSTTANGNGGALWCLGPPKTRQTINLLRCTIGGNTASAAGGGLFADASGTGKVTIDTTIVAGNTAIVAPDCDGTIVSNGYNCIGDTSGTTITGNHTGNLLGVDPLYVDPAHGDFTLQPISPCVVAGDPAAQPTGQDAAGHSRLLDGNLDRVMVLDMGAYEFDNVNLAITGQATPGGTLTFTTTGTNGLPVFLLLGVGESELRWRPFGSLFIDLGAPWLLVPWGTVPSTQNGSIPATIPVPLTLFFQELALQSATRSGNLGNLVVVTIE